MKFRVMIRFQKCLYFNVYIYLLWVIVNGFFLYHKHLFKIKVTIFFDDKLFLILIRFHKFTFKKWFMLFLPTTSSIILHKLGHLSKYLSATVFVLLTGLESIRLYLGHYGNLSCRVPELAGFLMLTTLMQMPLISFFLFNPYLLSTPTEAILHLSLWSVAMAEIILSYLALKQASSVAKSIYFSHSRRR